LTFRSIAIIFAVFLFGLIILADLGYLRFLLRIVSRIEYLDKVLHFLLVGTLAFLSSLALIETLPDQNPRWLLLIVIGAMMVIFTIEEALQGPIRGREASLNDLAANYAGILFFGVMAWMYNKKRKL